MKTLAILPLVFVVMSCATIPNVVFYKGFENRKPLFVKSKINYKPMVWFDMVDGVKKFEGYYAKPYVCSGLKRTIGFGHTGKYVKRGHVSKREAHEILLKDLKEAEKDVKKYVKVPLTDGQLACLISFTFNCGSGSLQKLVSGDGRLNSGNYKSVEKILPMYRRANGKVLKGLEKRRIWELKLWRDEGEFFVKN